MKNRSAVSDLIVVSHPRRESIEESMAIKPRLMTRRELIALMSAAMLSRNPLRAQDGMASRGLAPAPRPKPSGKAFTAHFIDVAASAGLRSPAICGAVD